jgi:hypothetical protein
MIMMVIYQMSKQCGQYDYSFEEQKKRFPFGTKNCETLEDIQSMICCFCMDDCNCCYCPKGYKDCVNVYEQKYEKNSIYC